MVKNKDKLCRDCNNLRIHHHEEYIISVTHPNSPPSPPPTLTLTIPLSPLFNRPPGCIDQLTLEERSAIGLLDKLGMKQNDIATMISCNVNTVALWEHRQKETHILTDADRSGRTRCTSDHIDEQIELYTDEKGIGQAEVWVGEFKAKTYVDILQHNLIQTARDFYPNQQWWFQQDNAPQHTSKLATRWFHNHGVSLIDFPPYSPDLNPIENLFGILKSRIENRLAHTIHEVERILKEEWEALDEELLCKLIYSMPNRCAEVIANRGHKSHY